MHAIYHAVLCKEDLKIYEKGLDFDRKLYVARRVFEQSNEDTYVVSLSSRTIVYKGMFLVGELQKLFSMICRMRIMNLLLRWYIQDSQQIQIRAGRELIQTDLLCITVRSIPFAVMQIKCLPVRKQWNPSSLKGELHKVTSCCQYQTVQIPQCLIIHWNFW